MSNNLSNNIKELRLRKKLTQQQLADRLHKGCSTVRMWELGKSSPDSDTLIELSKIFNVSTDYLLSFSDTMSIDKKETEPVITPKDKQISRINKGLASLNTKQLKLINELIHEISNKDNQPD